MEHFTFNYNVAIDTINCINDIDYTYHIIRSDYPILHTHDDYYEFTIVTDGEIINVRNGNKETITKNTLFISNSSDAHFLKKTKGEMKIINIIARSRAISELIFHLFPDEFNTFITNNKNFVLSDDIMHLINKNIETVNSLSAKDWQLTNSLLKSTISLILNYIFVQSIKYSGNDSVKYKKFIKKLNALKSNSNFFKLGVNDLCYQLGYSRTHLNRIFYELYSESTYTYLLKAKMEYAASYFFIPIIQLKK